MRKVLLCVLTTALLLASCGGGGAKISPEEEKALAIRAEYAAMTSCAAKVALTADYGQRVYQYELTLSVSGEETILTLSAPETVAGITARLTGTEGRLEFDGVSLETGPLDGSGLTPMSALPALLETAKSGFISTCSFETMGGAETVRVDCVPPDGAAGEGTQTSLWFDGGSHALVQGEILSDGLRVILCGFSEFSMA